MPVQRERGAAAQAALDHEVATEGRLFPLLSVR
jgi:hypothetical protein